MALAYDSFHDIAVTQAASGYWLSKDPRRHYERSFSGSRANRYRASSGKMQTRSPLGWSRVGVNDCLSFPFFPWRFSRNGAVK